MLFKRTCLLVDYEDASKALEKAKPNKRQAVSIKSCFMPLKQIILRDDKY